MTQQYLPMFLIFLVSLGVCLAMWGAGAFLGPKNPTPDKMAPFECGNDTEGAQNTKVSAKFYLTAILFVVFDIEVVFLYPWAVQFRELGWLGFGSMLVFLAALIVALVYVWKKGALKWEN